MITNAAIRQAAKDKGVKLWEIADRFGMNDGNFSRKLRHELPQDQVNKILAIVDEIADSRGSNQGD